GRVLRHRDAVHLDRVRDLEGRGLRTADLTDQEPDENEGGRSRRDVEPRAAAVASLAAGESKRRQRLFRPRHLFELGGELGRRAGLDEEVVDPLQPVALGGRNLAAEELIEVGDLRPAHLNSPSRASARRPSPARVRVLTVPSGIPRKSATSRCDRPPQYASSMTSRSLRGRSSSARWTRHETNDASARSSGPSSSDGVSGTSIVGSNLLRARSTIAFRATA